MGAIETIGKTIFGVRPFTEMRMKEINEKVRGACVSVRPFKKDTLGVYQGAPGDTAYLQTGEGSGFVVARDLIVTNDHVVREGDKFLVDFVSDLSGRNGYTPGRHVARVAAKDTANDLAVLQIAGSAPCRPLRLKRFSLSSGESVLGMKNPWINRASGCEAVVRGYGKIPVDEYGAPVTSIVLESPGVQRGDSGNPIVDRDGNVAGVIFKASFPAIPHSRFISRYSLNGFAIPVRKVKALIKEAKRFAKQNPYTEAFKNIEI